MTDGTFVSVGVCLDGDEPGIEELKTKTHDIVVDLAGEHRSSAVTWRLYDRLEGIKLVSRFIESEDDVKVQDYYRLVNANLVEYPDSVLVVATADGVVE